MEKNKRIPKEQIDLDTGTDYNFPGYDPTS